MAGIDFNNFGKGTMRQTDASTPQSYVGSKSNQQTSMMDLTNVAEKTKTKVNTALYQLGQAIGNYAINYKKKNPVVDTLQIISEVNIKVLRNYTDNEKLLVYIGIIDKLMSFV